MGASLASGQRTTGETAAHPHPPDTASGWGSFRRRQLPDEKWLRLQAPPCLEKSTANDLSSGLRSLGARDTRLGPRPAVPQSAIG